MSSVIHYAHATVVRPPAGFPADKQEAWLRTNSGEIVKVKTSAPGLQVYPAGPDKFEPWWVHTAVAEFDTTTFAMATLEEYTYFRLLISLDKVAGTRAMEIMSKAPFHEVRKMDAKGLAKIAGEVTAKRLGEALARLPGGEVPKAAHPHEDDAVAAVKSFHPVAEAKKRVAAVLSKEGSESLSLEEVIKQALKTPAK